MFNNYLSLVCHKVGSLNNLKTVSLERKVLTKNQLRMKIMSCGLNYPDLLMIEGKYQFRPQVPFVPGMEFTGKIIESKGNDKSIMGKRFTVVGKTGGFSEEIIVEKKDLLNINSEYSNDQAASYQVAAQTAYISLIEKAKIKKNQTLIITGASGGIGSASVKLAKHIGCIVIAIVSNNKKAINAKNNGADYVFYYEETLKNKIMQITNNRGADLVLDITGGNYLRTLLSCLKWGGTLLIVGFSSGEFSKIFSNYILIKGLTVIGIRAGEYLKKLSNKKKQIYKSIYKLSTSKVMIPDICASFPLVEARSALKLLKNRKTIGKVVLKINTN